MPLRRALEREGAPSSRGVGVQYRGADEEKEERKGEEKEERRGKERRGLMGASADTNSILSFISYGRLLFT